MADPPSRSGEGEARAREARKRFAKFSRAQRAAERAGRPGLAPGALAAKHAGERATRIRNHNPALKLFCKEVNTATAKAFVKSRTVDGDPFVKLSDATLEKRVLKAKGTRTKSKKAGQRGRLTKGAKAKRAKVAAKERPLIDTGTAQNSAKSCRVVGRNLAVWSAVGYLLPHMTGATVRKFSRKRLGLVTIVIPKRNPTVFDVDEKGRAQLKPKFGQRLNDLVLKYIEFGKVG